MYFTMSQTPLNTTQATPNLAISKFRIQNFKAIRDSGDIEFTPLTVFVGANGVGKSSLVEGLETLKKVSREGLNQAFQNWQGFEHICNRTAQSGDNSHQSPMTFKINGNEEVGYSGRMYSAYCAVIAHKEPHSVGFLKEELQSWEEGGATRKATRTSEGIEFGEIDRNGEYHSIESSARMAHRSILARLGCLGLWQFVRLNPVAMIHSERLNQATGYVSLATDGSNIAEYLLDIQQKDPSVMQGIVETVQCVLPYVNDVQPVLTTETVRFAHLQLTEQSSAIPGWLFSSGTLRLVALLALFRHPKPPPLIVIEEIENGLDPSTIAMIVEEIREVVRTGKSQIVLTTHSPYLMNLLPLKSLMLVERVDGEPRFFRPANDESLARWSEDFAPGDLYAMGRLRRNP